MNVLLWLEGLAPAVWVRESLWGYPIVLSLHALGMALVVGIATVIDLRLLGVLERIPLFLFVKLLPVIWSGFAINATTGVLLYLADASTLSFNAVFLAKLAAILGGFVLALALRRSVRRSLAAPARARAPAQEGLLDARLLAAASLLIWYGAIALGRYTAFEAELQAGLP